MKKLKKLEKEKNRADLENVWQSNYEFREKLRDLEDQSSQDNIWTDGLDEYKIESWEEIEELLIETFSNHLGSENVKIERVSRAQKFQQNVQLLQN